ncbi:MAG: hypothetical protein JW744_04945 [Candidatus Diapherotrites archaeon]|uniref:Uncharacterized protein n=1 Tax=Candidatus Iainarchaeum sp. TaxID=3101447 RepID=A0A939C7L7_9ARCH|nr:hypothetical protein [Candidatus Diapherotrites archaeon]
MPKPKKTLGGRSVKKKAGNGKGKKIGPDFRVRMPKYEMPKTRRGLYRDAAIIQCMLKLPDAPTKMQVIREYGINGEQFDLRAKQLRPIVRAVSKRMVVDTLLEFGRETAINKGGSNLQ